MPQSSPRVSLPYLQPSQAQKHITHNEALQRLDAVTQLTVQGVAEVTPPTLPTAGDMYGLGSGATGVWAGQDGLLAYWDGTGWLFLSPQEGWRAWGMSEQALFVWRAGAWQALLDGIETLGINTGADLTNRLSVAATASLFSHAGAGHQLKINKAADTETASLLFQSNWTGHAEMGLAGDSAFALKISTDGTSWDSVLRADPATQEISFAPAGTVQMVLGDARLSLDVPVTGTAVQQSQTDATAGRLLTVGAFGLGDVSLPDRDPEDLNMPTQFFRTTAASGNGPTVAYWHTLHMSRVQDQQSAQFAILDTSNASASLAATRHRDSTGVWSDWNVLFGRKNILGTVSETSGVPAGAVIERGSNANGEYVRYADGTQICTVKITTSSSADTTWTYPAAFSSTSHLAVSICPASNSNAIFGQARPISSTTSVDLNVWTTAGARIAAGSSVIAIGRWF